MSRRVSSIGGLRNMEKFGIWRVPKLIQRVINVLYINLKIFSTFHHFSKICSKFKLSFIFLGFLSCTSDEAVKKYRVIYRGARADVRTLSAKLCNTWARAWFLPARFRERSQRISTVVRSIDSRDHENTF